MPNQPSFRRFLLTRLLLFSIPILLIGMGVTFRKTREALVEARQMALVERASRQADSIQRDVDTWATQLAIASQNQALLQDNPDATQRFLEQFVNQMSRVECLSVADIETGVITSMPGKPVGAIAAGRCDSDMVRDGMGSRSQLHSIPPQARSASSNLISSGSLPAVYLSPVPPSSDTENDLLPVLIQAPIYDEDGRLQRVLSAQVELHALPTQEPISFNVIVDEAGQFLTHPNPDWVGRNINEVGEPYYQMLLGQLQETSNLPVFTKLGHDESTWLVGASPVPLQQNLQPTTRWTVLAVMPLEQALQPLSIIKQGLVLLALGLVGTHALSALLVARSLARPLERLSRYTRQIELNQPLPNAPHNLGVQELNQLASVLDDMVRRLEERATELEDAWHEAEAANRLKSDFLTTTSHELRTPLNAIIGCIQLVRDGYCDSRDEELDLLKKAESAALHLLNIINDLLDIRSIEAGTVRLFPTQVDACQLVRDVVALQEVAVQRKQIDLSLALLSEPAWVMVDADRMRQVLLNVLANAVKFTDAGEIAVTMQRVIASDRAGSPQSVVITVRDTGIGIAPDQQHKLFRPFGMADASTTRKYEGTGLGLAISRSLIEKMGGTIQLFSEGLNLGTCVEISLPVVSSETTQQAAPTQTVLRNGAIALPTR